MSEFIFGLLSVFFVLFIILLVLLICTRNIKPCNGFIGIAIVCLMYVASSSMVTSSNCPYCENEHIAVKDTKSYYEIENGNCKNCKHTFIKEESDADISE